MPNDARNKLVRLLNDWGTVESEALADYLIANGIILPPCKIGDTVYEAVFFKKSVFSHWVASKVVGFHLGDFPTLRGQKRKQYIVVWHSFPNCICHIPLDNFGKSVFFKHQLEDAEKRLKEGADNAE